ncbi:GNAT family N-acetyltransferase [Roseateles sp. UC29_93]|uniref:GNAT family N-acetyltransferase n=1 Tax=Roseateles sp. UC29_93 TaxID=3350177 RepID=UPI00366DF836
MSAVSDLLAAYDAQLRSEAETPSAIAVALSGPLRLVTFARGRGFVTYRDLGGADATEIRRLVGAALRHYQADPAITHVEWKSRGHDLAPGLHEALIEHGFEPDPPESIMVGEARLLVADVPLPAGVTIRTIRAPREVARMCAMQAEVFGDLDPEPMTLSLLERLARNDGMSLWIAEADGELITAGRLEPVAGTAFAGIWGGATRPAWRGRGVYRALTAARARAALALGKTLIHSDSTDFSRSILEASGLVKVSTTTPYNWERQTVRGVTPSPLRSRE